MRPLRTALAFALLLPVVVAWYAFLLAAALALTPFALLARPLPRAGEEG